MTRERLGHARWACVRLNVRTRKRPRLASGSASSSTAPTDTVMPLDEVYVMQEDPWIFRAVDVGYRNCKFVERVDGDRIVCQTIPSIAPIVGP